MAIACLLASGCSLITLGYAALPTWLIWQLDGYVGLDKTQEQQVSEAIAEFKDWHRRTQLPKYAAFLRAIDDRVRTPVDMAALTHVRREVRASWAPAVEQMSGPLARLALSLTPEQMERLSSRLQESNVKFRKEMLGSDEAERVELRIKRLASRAEYLLGSLSAVQEQELARRARAMPATERLRLQERERRQRSMMELVRALQREQPPLPLASRRVRDLLLSLWDSPHPPTESSFEAARESADELTLKLLSMASPQQREHLSERLRSLAASLDRQVAAGDVYLAPGISLASVP